MTRVFYQTPAAGIGPELGGLLSTKQEYTARPAWLKVTPTFGPNYQRVKAILKTHGLHSVCQEAACPNIRECFEGGTATFLILGNVCTRMCRFCDVISGAPKGIVDHEEPARLALAVADLRLKQVVITSVTRDDLPDGGATIFARTIELLRQQDNNVKIEVLIPDMLGKRPSVATVLAARPDVFAHNVETIGRLYKWVRPGARLLRSLDVLNMGNEYNPRPVVKTGFMVGHGETFDELVELMHQIYQTGTQIITIGQYLRPSPDHLPVQKFWHPDEFAALREEGLQIGFGHVESGPLVRSSYKAFDQAKELLHHG